MTNQQILTKAIQKAIDGGWLPYFVVFDTNMTRDNIVVRYPEGSSSVNFDYQMKGHIVGVGGHNLEPSSIIFNHDFAKALWGEELGYTVSEGVPEEKVTKEWTRYEDYSSNMTINNWQYWIPAWAYHLQQMVIAEDPIKYLGENI